MAKISIMTGKPLVKINSEFRNLHTDATLVVGNLINESLFERTITPKDKKLWNKRKEILKFFQKKSILETPVYHCYGSDRSSSIRGSYSTWNNYYSFYHLSYIHFILGHKIIGISGFYRDKLKICKKQTKTDLQNLYFFDTSLFNKIIKEESWCDILVINSMLQDEIIVFPQELYNMVFYLKPKLVVIGGLDKLQLKKFPLTDIDLLLVGHNDHVIYDFDDRLLFRKL